MSVARYVMARKESIPVWNPEELVDAYSAMATDEVREREAEEWAEALITDSSPA